MWIDFNGDYSVDFSMEYCDFNRQRRGERKQRMKEKQNQKQKQFYLPRSQIEFNSRMRWMDSEYWNGRDKKRERLTNSEHQAWDGMENGEKLAH